MSMNRELSLNEMKLTAGGAATEDPIIAIRVEWEDGNGHKYSCTKHNREPDLIIQQKVTWEDGNGHKYSTTCAN